MSIEINGPQGRAPAEIADSRKPAATPSRDSTSSAASGSTSSTTGSDKLSLTSEATQLRALEDEINALPAIDTQRVQEVQRSLATGSFQIDPARVADKMLQFEAAVDNAG